MDNQNFGKEFFTKSFDPIFITAGASARTTGRWASRCSRKLVPRVGVTVGYFRRWFGNFYTWKHR